ncbi:hypothetical protein C3L33_16017, partial [Rhododendron williamsianum]
MAEEPPITPPPPQCWSNIVKQQKPLPNHHHPVSGGGLTAAAPDRVFVDSCKSSKGIAVAVVDATAIIQGGEKLVNCADKFVSVSEVMDEVKDPMSRHRLNFVPFTVETREPSPESLKKVLSIRALTVIKFARATGDLQTLSDVDLKLIALTYTLESQIHGTAHLRDIPPPIHTVNVKRLPEKDMPGWGSNVPNLEEWEALEPEAEAKSNPNSRILPLKDLDLNAIPTAHHEKFTYEERVNIEGKKMVADGVDASQGQFEDDAGDWLPAVSRSTHRKYLRRKAKREMYGALSEKDSQQDAAENVDINNIENETHQLTVKISDETPVDEILEERKVSEEENIEGGLSTILNEMRLEEDSLKVLEEGKEAEWCVDGGQIENVNEELEHWRFQARQMEVSMLRMWMTTVVSRAGLKILMGLRLLAPGGMQIRQLHRSGRIFCPSCGNGGTLRKVAVTVGENGIVLAARRPRISLRGTQFSLPLPKGGRDAITKNPILREDQLPQKFLYPKTKKKNKQGDDIFSSDDIFRHQTGKKAPLQPPVRKALAVFSGKRNPNDNHYSRSKH